MISIRGARTHNLRSIDVDLPVGRLIVMTGVSGSGKSSLAFDTLFAEGQRRYLECVSVQSRSLLRQLPRPDVDEITGLAPAVSVSQRVTSVPARGTLATITEIHDYLRLLYARGGTAHCTACQQPVRCQPVDQIVRQVLQLPERTRLIILSPLVRSQRGAHREVLEKIARHGFVRARINGETVDVSEATITDPGQLQTIEAVVDRLVVRDGMTPRLRESVELACRESHGTCIVSYEENGRTIDKFFSTRFHCPDCDLNFSAPELRSFSFSSPQGACPECSGLGVQGGVTEFGGLTTFSQRPCSECGGSRLQAFPRGITFLGFTLPDYLRQSVDEALLVTRSWLDQLTDSSTNAGSQPLTQESRIVAEKTLPEIMAHLQALSDAGIGYLRLDRAARTLSGGEFQRARLAASLSSQIHGAQFVLDEPTTGLHPRDTKQLLTMLFRLRDNGGTVIVVEHDEEVIRAADWLIDLGPGAGTDGGRLLFSGTPADAERDAESPTGDFLRGKLHSPAFLRNDEPDNHNRVSAAAKAPEVTVASSTEFAPSIRIVEACLHNLQSVTVEIPLQKLVCVSGVSGSGKSSLVFETLLPFAYSQLRGDRPRDVALADVRCSDIIGLEQIVRIQSLDQQPAGRSSRSCIATLCGIWDEVRRLYAKTREARARGLTLQHFSFNSGAGRCSECRGTGVRRLRMNFLPDTVVSCPECRGNRFRGDVCSIHYRSRSIPDVLRMRLDEAAEFFSEIPKLSATLATFRSVGLGYMTLGQPASTFSGGEMQRVRLACELAVPVTDPTLFVMDEPTSGLHPADIARLLLHLRKLVQLGHSVLVIEHNPDVIRTADWVIDMGPESADRGGRIVCAGPPAFLKECPESITGRYC